MALSNTPAHPCDFGGSSPTARRGPAWAADEYGPAGQRHAELGATLIEGDRRFLPINHEHLNYVNIADPLSSAASG